MRHLAAYALLVVGGNEAPTQDQVTQVITAAGGEVDEAKLAALFADLEGKNIHELLAKGDEDLKSVVGVASAGNSCHQALGAIIFQPIFPSSLRRWRSPGCCGTSSRRCGP